VNRLSRQTEAAFSCGDAMGFVMPVLAVIGGIGFFFLAYGLAFRWSREPSTAMISIFILMLLCMALAVKVLSLR
jgi:hypothetical protein